MFENDLQITIENFKRSGSGLYLRTLLKEVLQNYILNFVYNSKDYKELIFTGGTCLRKVYGLPRLSEDLDFDYTGKFSIGDFEKDIRDYFFASLQYKKLETKISRNRKTLFLKFPILKKLGVSKTNADSPLLFVRCDFSKESLGIYETEINQISTKDYSFFARSYDLPTLFANKIVAFLGREYFRGSGQKEPFKGRDLFDLVWFLEKATRNEKGFSPNWKRIFKALNVKDKKLVAEMILAKSKKIDKKSVVSDLKPFIEDSKVLESFSRNYPGIIKNKVGVLSM